MRIDMDLRPCHEADSALWTLFCAIAGRTTEPSDIWTVYDVHQRALEHFSSFDAPHDTNPLSEPWSLGK